MALSLAYRRCNAPKDIPLAAVCSVRWHTEQRAGGTQASGSEHRFRSVVAALNDVLGNTEEMKTGLAGHGHLAVATTGDQMNEAGLTVGILAETVF